MRRTGLEPGGARCAETDPEAFFPVAGQNARPAKEICNGCDLKDACLDNAIKNKLTGIWGGTSDHERRALRKQLNRKAA